MDSLYFLTAGLAVLIGGLMGMLGGGGTVLLVPVLLYVLKLPPKSALATAQLTLIVSAGLSTVINARRGRVAWRTGLLFGIAGMLGAYLGGRGAHHIPGRLLLLGFSAIMVVSAIEMLRRGGPSAEPGSSPISTGRARGSLVRDSGIGFVIGLIAGTLGAGGGFLLVPALTLLESLPLELAVGTSLLIIAMQSLAGALGYLLHVEVDLRLAAILTAGMALGSTAGSLLGRRIPAALLRKLFAGFLIAVALFMLMRNL